MIVAILLSQLHALVSLDYDVVAEVDDRPPFVGNIFRQALNSARSRLGLPPFQSLKAVTISSLDSHHVFSLNQEIDFDTQVASLFDLPAVKSITIGWVAPEPPIWPGREPVASTLTTLIFRNSRLDEDLLGQLLAATPNLKILECPLAYDVEIDEYCHCAKLGSALEQIETTVESLTISVDFWSSGEKDETWGLYPGVVGLIGSMKGYAHLKYVHPLRYHCGVQLLFSCKDHRHLEMPLVVLLGWYPDGAPWLWDVLPQRLETFCCRDDLTIFETYKWTREEMLEEFTDYLSGACLLKEVALRLLDVRWGEWHESELRRTCEAAGVACRIYSERTRCSRWETMQRSG